MSVESANTKEAFVDVRRAFRLLHQYHRVLQDVVEVVGSTFNLEHYTRQCNHCGGTPNSGTDIRGRWAWDFLPLYDVTLLYFPRHLVLSRKDSYYKDHQPGDWMLELTFTADSEYDGVSQKGEPDPTKFKSCESSDSDVWVRLWYLDEAIDGENWLSSIWNNNDYPGEDTDIADIHLDGDTVGTVVESHWDFEDIVDRSTLETKISEFKTAVEAEIPEIGWA